MSEENKDDGLGKVRELISGIREDIGTQHTDLQAKLDGIEKARETEAGDLGKLREELEGIKTQADEREKSIREIEQKNSLRLERDPAQKREQGLIVLGAMVRSHLCAGMRSEVPSQFASERELVDGYMRESHERATLDETTAAGGYFVPTVLVMDLYNTLEEVSQLLSVVDFQTGVPTKGTGVTLTGRPTLQPKRATSDTKMTQSDPAFGQYSWDTDEAHIYFPVDNWMLQLSPIQLGQRMLAVLRDAYVGGICDWLINADGSATYNGNTGMLSDAVNAVAMAAGTFESLSNADLRKVMRSVLLRARRMGAFVGGGYVVDVLEEVSRTGKMPILREKGDGSYSLKGKLFIEDEGMPDEVDSGAGKALLGFGDPKTWAVTLAGSGIQLAADTSYRFAYNQTAFRAVGHLSIDRKPGKTWALLNTKA